MLNAMRNRCVSCYHVCDVSPLTSRCTRFPPHPEKGWPEVEPADGCGEWVDRQQRIAFEAEQDVALTSGAARDIFIPFAAGYVFGTGITYLLLRLV